MKNFKPLIIVLLGPTASGKTDLAIEIAKTIETTRIYLENQNLIKLKRKC